MTKKILLFSSITIAAISAVAVISTKSLKVENKYNPRTYNFVSQEAGGMMDFYKSIRKNVNTGEIEAGDFKAASLAVDQMNLNANRAVSLSFVLEGPDNQGGRTRAILVDKDDINTVYAGSVSGGLFKSTDRGNTWYRLDAFSENLAVSCLAQTKSGTIYVGTGATFENSIANGNSGGHRADGVWYSDDDGATFSQISASWGTAPINELAADPNANDKVWVAGNLPVRLTSVENKTTLTVQSDVLGDVQDVQVSPDGNIMICNTGARTWVSTNAGGNFTRVSGPSAGQIKETSQAGISRIEYAISHEKNSSGAYTIYAVQVKPISLGVLAGIAISEDNGQTWTEIIPETPNSLSAADALNTDPFSGGTQWQGNYDCAISVVPGNPKAFIVGGVRLFKWEMSSTQAPYGNFYPFATNQATNTSPIYVHSDIHKFYWDKNDRLYIGHDGGISISDNATTSSPTYYEANRGYSTLQYYGIGYSARGDVMGGAQDNGTTYKNVWNPGTTPYEFTEVYINDGFDCDISFLNHEVGIMSSQTGVIVRSADLGNSWSTFYSSEMEGLSAPFHTTVRLFENDNDTNSTDSVTFIATENKNAGETIMVPSKNMSLLFPYTLTQPLVVTYDTTFVTTDTVINGVSYNAGDTALLINYQDTIRVKDVMQTLTATGLTGSGGVWVTRGALRFGTTPIWWKVLNTVGEVRALEFSKDGNILYIGETSGKVTRIKGFNNVYYNNEAGDTINSIENHDSVSYNYADVRSGVQGLEVQVIRNASGGQAATGIAVDPNDPEHVVVTLGGYGAGTNIVRSTTAASTTGASSFTSIKGNLPTFPVYDAVIDFQNSNIIVIGTEMGIYATDNAGTTWSSQNAEVGKVPVFALRQQWRPWNKVYGTQGVIYAGTHGRGLWSTSGLAGIRETVKEKEENSLTPVKVYPNPAIEFTNIEFDLAKSGRVDLNVYSISGQLIETKTISNAQAGKVKTTLDLTNYTKGTYFVNVSSQEGGAFKVAKFIKR